MSLAQHLYFIYNPCTEMVKIGKSVDPDRRLVEIQQLSGVPVTLLGVLHGEGELEFKLHLYFAAQRRIGEWFVASDELLALAAKPKTVPDFIKRHAKRIKTAHILYREMRKAAGSNWMQAALREKVA
jgi:hypothetical protein